jgi:2-oxoglutarate ferredoxin oxidoreductase subunit alpha
MRKYPVERPKWSLTGAKGRQSNLISSIHLGAEKLEAYNQELQSKLRAIELNNEVLYFEQDTKDAEIVIVAFGTAGRVAQTAVKHLRQAGIHAGLLRPITLWPFPKAQLVKLAKRVRGFLVVEMNAGQMVHDVREVVDTHIPVRFYGRMGGAIPMPDEIKMEVTALQEQITMGKLEGSNGHVS